MNIITYLLFTFAVFCVIIITHLEDDMKEVIWVSQQEVDNIKKATKKFHKKAMELECELPQITFSEVKRLSKEKGSDGLFGIKSLFKVTIEGNPPRLDDWEVIAQLDHKRFGDRYENIVQAWGICANILQSTETKCRAPSCDHCEAKRERKTTYLLRHRDTDEIIQIGSTCIEDFTKKSSLKSLLLNFKVIETVKSAKERTNVEPTEFSFVSLSGLVSTAITQINQHGFVSKGDAQYSDKTATSDAIIGGLAKGRIECDHDLTKYVLEELHKSASQNTNFAINLKNSITRDDGHININNRYAVAVIAGAISTILRKKEKEDNDIEFSHDYAGLVSDRKEFTLTLISTYAESTSYGMKDIFYFVDELKRRFKWTCWGSLPDVEMKVGNLYELTATISKHDDYKIPTTVINRCKKIRVINDDPKIIDKG